MKMALPVLIAISFLLPFPAAAMKMSTAGLKKAEPEAKQNAPPETKTEEPEEPSEGDFWPPIFPRLSFLASLS